LGITEETVRQKISRLRKRLPEALRAVVRDSLTEATTEAVDDEIASLREALRKN
jgi:DNA-binding winged helix-turn-helix (wHTH) protein